MAHLALNDDHCGQCPILPSFVGRQIERVLADARQFGAVALGACEGRLQRALPDCAAGFGAGSRRRAAPGKPEEGRAFSHAEVQSNRPAYRNCRSARTLLRSIPGPKPMRDAQTVAKINNAVKACVHEACESANPLAALMRRVDSLRDSGEWSHDELAEFESAVLAILKQICRPPAGNKPDA